MPIYAYRCEACGFAKDVLQKMSDAPLTDCLACGKPSFKKQVTAAGFQLKGSGWYVTDFRGDSKTSAPPTDASASVNSSGDKPAATTPAPVTETKAPSESKTAAPASGGADNGGKKSTD